MDIIILEHGLFYRVKATRYNKIYVTIEREIRRNKYSRYWKPRAYGTLQIKHCTKIHNIWGEKQEEKS